MSDYQRNLQELTRGPADSDCNHPSRDRAAVRSSAATESHIKSGAPSRPRPNTNRCSPSTPRISGRLERTLRGYVSTHLHQARSQSRYTQPRARRGTEAPICVGQRCPRQRRSTLHVRCGFRVENGDVWRCRSGTVEIVLAADPVRSQVARLDCELPDELCIDGHVLRTAAMCGRVRR